MYSVLETYQQRFEWYMYLMKKGGYGDEEYTEKEWKVAWLCHHVLDITTYSNELDIMFGKVILDVLKAILERTTYEYIDFSDENHINFILVCNQLINLDWIEWGTSIRGCWFEYRRERSKLIFGLIEPTEENIRTLIKFVEE